MAATWPSVVRSDYDPDKAVRTGRVKALCDMRLVLMRKPFHLYFPETTRVGTSAGSFVAPVVFELFLPDYALGRTLSVTVECRVSLGTGSVRLRNNDTAVIGSAVNVTSTTYVPTTLLLAIPTTWAADAPFTLELQGAAPSTGTIFARNLDLIAAFFTD